MSQSVLIELELPDDWKSFQLPPALHERLQELLDRQDAEGKLSSRERHEATALTQLTDMLSLLRLRAERVAKIPTRRVKDWRRTFVAFTGDEMMQEIFEEGRKIREAERKRAGAPSTKKPRKRS